MHGRLSGRLRRLHVATLTVAVALTSACIANAEPPTSPTPVGSPERGGALVVGMLQPQSIAPWRTSTFDPYGELVVRTMCDTLTDHDAVTGEAKPAVAETVRAQEGGVVVRVREGLKFTDGSTVRAKDIVSTISAVANADVASPVADVVSPISGFENLNDPEFLVRQRSEHPKLPGLNSGEERSLTIGSDTAAYAAVLGHPVAAPVKGTALEDDPEALEQAPICVGPYVLAEPWEPGLPAIRLTRSAQYHGKNTAHTGGGRGWFDTIEFRIFPDRETVYRHYVAGEVDVAFIAPTQAVEARQQFPDDYAEALTGEISYIGLPLNTRPFDKPAVRLALSAALDRRAVADMALGGLGEPADRFLPPTLPASTFEIPKGAERERCMPGASGEPNVERARRLLDTEGVDLSAHPIPITFNDEYLNPGVVAEIARQWREAFGAEVTVQGMGYEQWIQQLRQPSGAPGGYRWSWDVEYPDPYLYLEPLFHSKHIGADNLTRVNDPDFDFFVEDSTETVNAESRNLTILRAESVICGLMPMVPVLFGERALLIRKTKMASALGDVFTDRTTGLPLLRDLYAASSQ